MERKEKNTENKIEKKQYQIKNTNIQKMQEYLKKEKK
jgi:hypothetical protein